MDNIGLSVKIAEKVEKAGGRAFYVGGFVRDALLGRPQSDSPDIDIEVHGITPDILKDILSSFGPFLETGKSFGIYSLRGSSIDIAMPRTENNTGSGHRDFEVFVDPYIGTKKAAERRDFTVNSIMKDVLTGEIIDHFGGMNDLKKKIIRHVNDISFCEDPLRVLRAAQFAARFEFEIASETVELCKKIPLDSLPMERIFGELEKALLRSDKPSIFFKVLDDFGALSFLFKELAALKGIPQPVKYHPEGDAYIHTLCVSDAAAGFRREAEYPLGFMLSAVCHDLGKATCTEYGSGDFHALGHEVAGVELSKTMLARLTNDKNLKKYVCNLVLLHMKPNKMSADGSSVKATNRMFDDAISQRDLILLSMSDISPAAFLPGDVKEALYERMRSHREFLEERLKIYNEYMSRPFVSGEDLINAGLEPGEDFSRMLCEAHKLRLSGIPKETVLKHILGKRNRSS